MAKDFSIEMETKKFNRTMKRFIKKSGLSTEVIIRKTAFDLLALILAGKLPSGGKNAQLPEAVRTVSTGRHPVLSGRSRAAWFASVVGLGKNFDFSKGVSSDDNQVSEGKNEGAFKNNLKAKSNKWVELINNVKYILFLEHGSSKQAPVGMVRISMRKLRGRMPKDLSKEFLKDWNKIVKKGV